VREAATICPRPLQVDLWHSDLESGVRVTCHVGYLFANFSLPGPLCSRLRPDVRDRQTSDAHHRLMPPILWGRGIIRTTRYVRVTRVGQRYSLQDRIKLGEARVRILRDQRTRQMYALYAECPSSFNRFHNEQHTHTLQMLVLGGEFRDSVELKNTLSVGRHTRMPKKTDQVGLRCAHTLYGL